MNRIDTQYSEIGHMSLGFQLSEHQQRHPKARLVSVILLPRNPGENEKYRAVWDYGSDGESNDG